MYKEEELAALRGVRSKGRVQLVGSFHSQWLRQRESIDGVPAFVHRQIAGTGCGDQEIAHPCAPARAPCFFCIGMGEDPQLAGR
jgi:hypothetical protein